MKITVCEFPDDTAAMAPAWDHLATTLAAAPTDLLVLPELVASGSFWAQPVFDAAVWRDAVARHEDMSKQFERLAARRILGTRAIETGGQRLNESFLWTPARGMAPGRAKAWLPQQEGGWEATWFDRAPPVVDVVDDNGLRFAMLICSEVQVSPAPRALGQGGVQLIAVPRATGGHHRWEVATRMAAIAAGAFVASANRRGDNLAAGNFAGSSWIIGPDGDELARTDAAHPVVTVEIDLALADAAKLTYPRNVAD